MSDDITKMRFGYSIIYVSDVPKTLEFYEGAFGLQTGFLHESQLYGELETGETTLAFAADEMAKLNGLSVRANRVYETAAGYEIALVTESPKSAFERAVNAGACPVKAPETKPWGQIVAYVRDNNGCIVEICSPIEKASGEV
jgi:uncharacterized glyoxalase superfamily protein PhnB